MMSPGRIFENRGAAATLLELSEQRRGTIRAEAQSREKPADVGAPAGLDLILPSQPCGVCGKPLPIPLPMRFASAASYPAPLGRLDLKPGIDQPPDNDLGRVFGVKDLRRKVGAAEKVGQNVLRGELAHDTPTSSPYQRF